MIVHLANRIYSASTRAGINALISYASTIMWTVCIENTFRATADIWITLVFGYACAFTTVALGISTTR